MSIELIILIVVLVLLFGGGGGYYWSRGAGEVYEACARDHRQEADGWQSGTSALADGTAERDR